MPIYIKLYFFHILNPDEVKSGKELPKLEERGPFTFLEYREKFYIRRRGKDHIR
jgi:hypothetical protein